MGKVADLVRNVIEKGSPMAYTKDTVPSDHSEFGGGPGLIDAEVRKDRDITATEGLMEIYATDTTSQGRPVGSTEPVFLEPATAPLGRERA